MFLYKGGIINDINDMLTNVDGKLVVTKLWPTYHLFFTWLSFLSGCFLGLINTFYIVPYRSRLVIADNEAFDFNDEILAEETNTSRKMHHGEQVNALESVHPSQIEEKTSYAYNTCSIARIHGLPSIFPKRKYTMTQHVRKKKEPQRIGSSRAKKVSLANVQQDLQSSICSKDYLKKLNVVVVLMK